MTMQQSVSLAANGSPRATWRNPLILLLVSGAYIVMATAAFFPNGGLDYIFILLNIGLAVLLLAANGRLSGKLAPRWAVLLPLVLCYIPAASAAVDGSMLLKKFEGAIPSTLLASALLYVALKKGGAKEVQQAWIAVGAAILVATIIYKLQYGFFDRQTRFFFNGPIVFGWLMGSMALLSVSLSRHSERMIWWISVSAVFSLAVVWSGSKGPLVALALAVSVVFVSSGAKRGMVVAGLFIGLIAVLLAFAPEQSLDRFRGMGDLVNRGNSLSDGSISLRKIAWQQAVSTFEQYPLTGAGLGNFQFFTNLTLTYPHNLFLESAAEAGMLGLVGLLTTLGLVFAMTPPIGRLWLFYVIVGMQFSGDIGYLRIALAMPIALAAHKSWQLQQRG